MSTLYCTPVYCFKSFETHPYQYHPTYGNVTAITDGEGHTTQITYDTTYQTFPQDVTYPTVQDAQGNPLTFQTHTTHHLSSAVGRP